MQPLIIYFKKTGEGTPTIPVKAYAGDAGYDLFVSRETEIKPGAFVDVPTDILAALPDGYWGRITGRSSTIRKWQLQVQEGVIDSNYRGRLFTGVWNMNTKPMTVRVGVRLAQLILYKIETAQWLETDELPPSERGARGFGSSGW